ncbi:kinase-like protein [Leucogyrophana mollusca]|uniref:Kinase-like protein n=1 Tax=Leucogyrophana mollusca TaxID=85980 RepID=A0ACB8BE43_9AGAM|nr:kinase-like protein [Leucogyrophana mollusca]
MNLQVERIPFFDENVAIQSVPTRDNLLEDSQKPLPTLPINDTPLHPADLSGQILREGRFPAAHGGFGDIWRCKWSVGSDRIDVAVKVIRAPIVDEVDRAKKSKRLRRELKVWARLQHECVLPLFGVTSEFGPFASMVCPWKENGTLNQFLGKYHEHLTILDQFHLLSNVAAGLRYLHSCSVIHGDLSGSNILVDGDGKACLADFGLSSVMLEFQGTSYFTSSIRGAVRWAAPEIYEVPVDDNVSPHIPTAQSDIYSFGSVMLQVISGVVPYHYLKNDAQVLIAISKGITPMRPLNPEIDDEHWNLIQQCWSTTRHGALRPSIRAIADFCAFEPHFMSGETLVLGSQDVDTDDDARRRRQSRLDALLDRSTPISSPSSSTTSRSSVGADMRRLSARFKQMFRLTMKYS